MAREITDPREIQDWENELFDVRANEQKAKQDYAYEHDGSIELCSDCKTPINSHDHCPRCDY